MKRLALVLIVAYLAGCGRVADLKPLMARTTPTAEDLLTPPTYARPDRVDELIRRSQPRQADPFDLPPPTGGAAPPEPAASQPATDTDTSVTPGD
jgi:hypothetical protein